MLPSVNKLAAKFTFKKVSKMSVKSLRKNDILKDLSLKLGINSNQVLLKSSELLRLLHLKTASNAKSLQQINDTCRNILCLDLASSSLGMSFDRDQAIELSGSKKKLYMNGYYMFEKLLGLEQQVSIKNISIQQGCSEVIELAEDILKRYVEEQSKGLNRNKPLDLEHPMYAAFAVYCACRHRKLKVNKQKLVEISRIKKADFDRMISEMSKVLSEGEKVKSAKKRKASLIDLVEQNLKDSQDRKKKINDSENCDAENANATTDYETWKKKMLAEANEDS